MNLLQDIIPTLWDRNFQPLAGGSVEVYTDPSISVLAKLYSSPGKGDTELPNPLPLNSAGRFSDGSGADTPVYFEGKGAYVIARDRNGVKAKEFLSPDYGLNGADASGAASIEELKEIEGSKGLYVLVRSPAPFRWYMWVGSNGANDGVFNIDAKDGNGYWRLVLQGNQAYSAWWKSNDLNEILDFLTPKMPGLDLCVNSTLNATSHEWNLTGRLALLGNAKIYSQGMTTINCPGGFEAAFGSFTQNVVFHVYGGAYSTINLQGIALSGFVNNLHLNSNWNIPSDVDLEVFTLSGMANCALTVWGALALTETSPFGMGKNGMVANQELFKIKRAGGSSHIELKGTNIAARVFSEMNGWGDLGNGSVVSGMRFRNEDEYDWSDGTAPTLGYLSGWLKFKGSKSPTIYNVSDSIAVIENNGTQPCPIPMNIDNIGNLKGIGKFSAVNRHLVGKTIDFELHSTFVGSTFINCVFVREFEIGDAHNSKFIGCVFEKDITLASNNSSSYLNMAIKDCFFKNDSKINATISSLPDSCVITGNTGNAANYQRPGIKDTERSITTTSGIRTIKRKIHTDAFISPTDFAIEWEFRTENFGLPNSSDSHIFLYDPSIGTDEISVLFLREDDGSISIELSWVGNNNLIAILQDSFRYFPGARAMS